MGTTQLKQLKQPKLLYTEPLLSKKMKEDITSDEKDLKVPKHIGSLVDSKGRQVPLKLIEFNVQITNSLAEVQISQVYFNDSNNIIETEFQFAITSKAAFHYLKVLFEDKIIDGVIKEKDAAKEEYKKGVSEGKTIAYSGLMEECKDIMRLKIGNILPQQEVTVILGYVEELEVCMNKFWRLTLVTTTTPRYTPDQLSQKKKKKRLRKLQHSINANDKNAYPVNINIDVNSFVQLQFIKSPTHPIKITSSDLLDNSKCKTSVKLVSVHQPNKDFILIFADQNLNKPQITVGKFQYPIPYCAQVTLVPEFNNSNFNEAYTAYVDDNNLQRDDFDIEQQYQRGEFIFLIDRSGSMEGSRIEKAKDALILFLKSLPMDCFFQIISFGSKFQKLFKQSEKYTEQTLQKSLDAIKLFDADLGGTEILKPLKDQYSSQRIKGYPRNIFLLTDGAVSNSDSVLKVIKENTKPDFRLYTLGIGSGCSRYLIDKSANLGGGMAEYVNDDEDLNDKVMTLLQDSITPFLENVKVTFPFTEAIDFVVPNPLTLNGIRKNKPFTFYIFLNEKFEQFNKKLPIVTVSYNLYGSGLPQNSVDIVTTNIVQTPIFHKLGVTQIIEKIIDTAKFNYDTIPVLSNGEQLSQKSIVDFSIKYGVLNEFTAFICVVNDNQDDVKRQMLELTKTKILVPIIYSQDYDRVYIKELETKQEMVAKQSCQQVESVQSDSCQEEQLSSPSQLQPNQAIYDQMEDIQNNYRQSSIQESPPESPSNNSNRQSNLNRRKLQKFEKEDQICKGAYIGQGEQSHFSNDDCDDEQQIPEYQEQPVESKDNLQSNIGKKVRLESEENEQDADQMVKDSNDIEDAESKCRKKMINREKHQEKEMVYEEEKMPKSKSIKIDYLQIITTQTIIGKFFYNDKLINQIGVDVIVFKKSIPQSILTLIEFKDVWMTMLILQWLEYHWKDQKNSWILVSKKSLDYLKNQDVNFKEYKDALQQML